MPTGYTAKLMEEGQSFPDFVMLCARAMGATIMMRDDPLDAPIPEFQPSDYHIKRIAEGHAELARLLGMSEAERVSFGEEKRAAEIARYRDHIEEDTAQNSRLFDMQAKVEAWVPPTPEHEGLKRFMLQQIETSTNSTGYWDGEIAKAQCKSELDYYAAAVAEARRAISYNADEDRKERERTDARNQWVKKLRESIGAAQPSDA